MSRDCGQRDYPFRYVGEKLWLAGIAASKIEPMREILASWAGYHEVRVIEEVAPVRMAFWSNDPDQHFASDAEFFAAIDDERFS